MSHRRVFSFQELRDVAHIFNDINNKNRDLSKTMDDSADTDQPGATNGTSYSGKCEVPAEMKAASVQNKEAPQTHLEKRELDPTPVDSGIDNQQFTEED